jgi:hypothetical protein
MRSVNNNRKKTVRSGLFLSLLLVGGTCILYLLSVSEPAKILLLGAALVGAAIWSRRYLKRQENP